MIAPEPLLETVRRILGDAVSGSEVVRGQAIATIKGTSWVEAARTLRDAPELKFEQLIDLCGLDYQAYGNGRWDGQRFAVVVQLLSVSLNQRLRVKVFATDDDFPSVDSVTGIWSGANWFEREAFDLFGIVFPGHADLRRILTDYGFIGHPFRKDFPVSGYVEMRYDPDQQRVIYQPVSIEPREIVPRVVREPNYGDVE
ncbi:MAG: NADH-quinone oxidoreductase subunit C [Burkholderiales bacterium]|jgi:NADH-quinone oxidoreductase subunit C|nr:NADH-quinone oxidoreductase subunit C [Burkholderiales bacterium]MBX9961875.1 NADH-quinone oxidoreductase subunit C [Burkholderiales bacterium]